jgi:hypothetical protein
MWKIAFVKEARRKRVVALKAVWRKRSEKRL